LDSGVQVTPEFIRNRTEQAFLEFNQRLHNVSIFVDKNMHILSIAIDKILLLVWNACSVLWNIQNKERLDLIQPTELNSFPVVS
jgi:hypothetical protein